MNARPDRMACSPRPDEHDGAGSAGRRLPRAGRLARFASRVIGALLLSTPAFSLELFYDFEGDAGEAVRDKLVADGAQDGILEGNATIVSSEPLWGARSANFSIPDSDPLPPPFSTFQVPGSTGLGLAYTIAIHVENLDPTPGFARVISSFRGTGAVGADRILVDYDPTGALIPGVRAIVNNVVVQTSSVPAALATPGYHHFALVASLGVVRLYLDGSEVAAGIVGLGYSNSADLRIGEDPHDAGGSADEQLIGNVDELLVIDRDLTPGEVLALAQGTVDSVVTPTAGEYAVYYDFESDLEDRFTLDGAQTGIAHRAATISADPADAVFGSGAGRLDLPVVEPFSRIDAGPVGNLGDAFTISVAVAYPQAGHAAGALTRLFSSHSGSGGVAGRLIFDFDPDATFGFGVRLILPDGTVVLAPTTTLLDQLHTFTATYDQGDVRLYVDGGLVATGSTTGEVDLGGLPLYLGEDADGPVNENFIGTLDDAFIVPRVLTPQEVVDVHGSGAAAVVPEPPAALGLATAMALLGALTLRRRASRSRDPDSNRSRGS